MFLERQSPTSFEIAIVSMTLKILAAFASGGKSIRFSAEGQITG
jgi:hypothetical protein